MDCHKIYLPPRTTKNPRGL